MRKQARINILIVMGPQLIDCKHDDPKSSIFFVILTLVTLNACFWTGDEAQRWTIHPEGTTSFSLSRDGRFALLSAKETGIFLWDLQQNQQLADFGPQDPNASAVIVSRISDNNRFAITATSQNFAVWDPPMAKQKACGQSQTGSSGTQRLVITVRK